MSDNNVTTRVQILMRNNGYDQVRLAQVAGINRATINRYINGKMEWSDRTIRRIADSLHVSYRWLKDGVGEMYEQPTGGNKIEGVSELIDDARAKTIMQQLGGHHNSQTAETAKADRQAEIDLLKKMVEDKDKEIEFLRQMLAKKE